MVVRATNVPILATAVIAAALPGCRTVPRNDYAASFSPTPPSGTVTEYRFGVQPIRPSRRLVERYGELLDQLNASVQSFRLRLVSAQSEETYQRRLRRGELDVAIIEPHLVLQGESLGYKAIARAGNADRIAGVIVVRRDSDIRKISDLAGKTIAFAAPTVLGSSMLIRMFLRDAGFNLDRSATAKYVGNHESALAQVATGESDAAGVSRDAWLRYVDENEYLSDRLIPKWVTEELPGAAVMVSARLPVGHRRELQRVLIGLRLEQAGKSALARAGFTAFRYGEEASYDALWEFLNNYARAFPAGPNPTRTE
jgi:phosphonate transport system substrate-binding protein